MSEPKPTTPAPEPASSQGDRIPRGAIAVVVVGLLLTVATAVLALNEGGGVAKELDWDRVELFESKPPAPLGRDGELQISRLSLTSLVPNAAGYRIFRIAGVLRLDTGAWDGRSTAQCRVTGLGPEPQLARTPKLRAAWPRPTDDSVEGDLSLQEVPELIVLDFHAAGVNTLGLPIRDSFNRYTDSVGRIRVDWPGYDDEFQEFDWTLTPGAATATTSLGFAVVFRTAERPEARIDCSAEAGDASAEQTVVLRAGEGERQLELESERAAEPGSEPGSEAGSEAE